MMSEVSAQSLRVSEIRDPAALFERYSTEEIRGVERRVRGEIEQKKEELRQMVGERYRDLIDAADTITEMRQCSESVVRSVRDMSRYCQHLKHNPTGPVPAGRTSTTLKHNEQWQEKFYTMASQIKLLLEIPERIWSSMESCQYLQATQLYLLCCHLHRELQLDTSSTGTHYSPVLARFPILIRQVATAGHFRSTILMESKLVLRGRAISDQGIAEALVSTMLLEDSSARQALHDFLLARKASIHQLLSQPQHVAGIKAQVCSLVELLVTTLFQAYAVFYLPPEGSPRPGEGALGCGMLFSTLENVTTPTGKGKRVFQDMSTGNWFRYLPASIAEFQPSLRTLAQPIQREQLRDTLQQWIDTCKEDLCSGISSLLVYVKSLKGLASIRDAVWDLLSSESISQHWGSVCQQMLERPLAMWEDFLQQLFLQRLQAITREETQGISASCTQLLSSALRDLESHSAQSPAPPSNGGSSSGSRTGAQYEADVASFLWSEGAGDLLSDAAWVSVSQRGQQQQQQQQCGGLAMKTQALTPCVQSFCSSLDAKLRSRLDDLQCYLPSQDKASSTTSASHSVPSGSPSDRRSSIPAAASPFDRFTDTPAVEDTLRENCLACMRHILLSVRSELAAAQTGGRPAHLSTVLFLARLCQSVGELCPNLKRCILGRRGSGTEATGKGTPGQSRKLGKSRAAAPEVTPAQAKWSGLNQELFACSMEAYGIWTDALSKVLVDPLSPALHTQSTGSILTTATNWEEIEIQEEAESGSSVTSKIRLPAQPSWFVQSLLFQLCVEVNRVGGHALPRPTLNQLLRSCLDRALQHYHALTQPDQHKEGQFPMTQNRALQLLFDLRYLSATLGTRPEEGKSSRSQQDPRVQEMCDWLESYIDPFDLDVFTPHLNANLNRLSQRTSVLLGLLTGTEKQFVSRSSSSVTSQEPYNILPLASSQIRFGLLPLSMTNARKAKSAIRTTATTRPLVPPASTPANDNTFRPGNLFRQLANQEEETAAPSLFKLGWLSGMSK